MGRTKKGGKTKPPAEPVYSSDDERAYSKEAVPDPTSEEYYQDEVDDFHARREKILLDKSADIEPAGFSSDEEEVMAFDDDDEEEEDIEHYEQQLKKFRSRGFKDELASDVEEEEGGDGDGLPDEKAWGKKRSKFYGADISDDEEIDFSGSETDAAILEEQEAMVIQKRMAEQLEEQDFGLDILKTIKKPKEAVTEEKISKDLSALSKKEKLQLLKKESPELLVLIEDYKIKMAEITDRLLPIFTLVKKGLLPPSKGTEYVDTKLRLSLNYCINLTFYVMLMAKRAAVQNHPVIGRLLQYRNLLKELEPADVTAKPEVDKLLQRIETEDDIQIADYAKGKPAPRKPGILKRRKLLKVAAQKGTAKVKDQTTQKRKLTDMVSDSDGDGDGDEEGSTATGGRTKGRKRGTGDKQTDAHDLQTEGEKEALDFYEMMKSGRKKAGGQAEGDEEAYQEDENYGEDMDGEAEEYEEEEAGKRGITYMIEKNKGLTPRRRKDLRNPRIKHKMKYKKAKIRRKGQVREVRTEMQRYSGELSGIRAGVKKSVRLK